MSIIDTRQYKYTGPATASMFALIILVLSPILFTDIRHIEIKKMGMTEVSWQDAMAGCNSLGEEWSLPSIYKLVAIHYRRTDVKLVDNTDYWSYNSLAGFAFGLNTGKGIASFDSHTDTDHFLCIQLSQS